jgi:hypothetical protein
VGKQALHRALSACTFLNQRALAAEQRMHTDFLIVLAEHGVKAIRRQISYQRATYRATDKFSNAFKSRVIKTRESEVPIPRDLIDLEA